MAPSPRRQYPSGRYRRSRAEFRYAPLSRGLDIVRKILGQHAIATVRRDLGRQSDARTPGAPISRMICSRIKNFCGLPVAVIGNSGTKRMYRGTL